MLRLSRRHMTHSEILLRVRAESFAAMRWPGRAFTHRAPTPLPAFVTSPVYLYSHWVTFKDEGWPRAFALCLQAPDERDPIFQVAELCPQNEVHITFWRYRSDGGWRHAVRRADTGDRGRSNAGLAPGDASTEC